MSWRLAAGGWWVVFFVGCISLSLDRWIKDHDGYLHILGKVVNK